MVVVIVQAELVMIMMLREVVMVMVREMVLGGDGLHKQWWR